MNNDNSINNLKNIYQLKKLINNENELEIINIIIEIKKNAKTLLIMADYNDFIYKSSRNLPRTKVVTVSDVNTYEILDAQKVILIENSLGVIDNLFNKIK